jgi:hypothetical protein
MKARLREVHGLGVGKLADLERLHAIEEGAGRILVVRIEIGERPRGAGRVPLLAARHAGMTADADIEIDHEGELGHDRRPPLRPAKNACHRGRFGAP